MMYRTELVEGITVENVMKDAKSIQDIFNEFEKKLKEYKKKEQAKKSVAPKKK